MERSDGHGRRDGDEARAVENHDEAKKSGCMCPDRRCRGAKRFADGCL